MSGSNLEQAGGSYAEGRQFERDAVRIGADLMVSGQNRFKVTVLDLSQSGFRIETANFISLHQIVYLTIPTLQPLRARIAWHNKEQYGCELTSKIHIAVFQHIAAAFPSLITQS
jgi:PilZ domain